MANLPIVVIVEDDPLLGQIFSKTLESDYEVEWIADGKQALTRLLDASCTAPTLVLLDINLPGVSGVKIYERVRADARLAKTHVIVCSADAQATEFLRDDVDLTLLKPVSPMQLRTLAGRFLEHTK